MNEALHPPSRIAPNAKSIQFETIFNDWRVAEYDSASLNVEDEKFYVTRTDHS